ncbi:MAG TPA: lamin tail domain-containing protein, partial [Kofleriaceae bacterium]|nr:lamin tail domain-containing protein [Kofleriaceae bacterium]
LEPATATVAPGGTVPMTVTLDIPAGPGGATVALSVAPGSAGGVPASVVVPEDELSAAFDFTAGATTGTETVTATLGASVDATITVAESVGGLVINEVDYDSVGADVEEFIEIYNGTSSPIDMSDYAIVLVNGAGNPPEQQYRRIDLSGTLAAGEYLVVGSASVIAAVPAGTLTVQLPLAQDNVQNGSPDALGLFQISSGALVDALSYEGELTEADTDFGADIDLSEGNPTPATDSNTDVGSLSRSPNGSDTDDAATDWVFVATPTPGTANASP